MKLLFYLKDLSMGGVERRTLRLMKAILDHSDLVTIDLVLNEKKGELLNFVDERINTYFLNTKGYNIISIILKLSNIIQKVKPSIIVAGFGQLAIISVIIKSLFHFNAKIVVIQASPVELVNAPIWLNIKRIVGAKLFYPNVDQIITVSKGIGTNLKSFSDIFASRTQTIYDPVIGLEICDKADDVIYHPFFEESESIIINVGRLAKEKDQLTLIKAFSLVKKDYANNVKLIIIGDGPERLSLERKIKVLNLVADVSLTGFLDNPYPYVKKASVFVLSSLWEGLGNALIEAMSLGTQVVSTDCNYGPAEILLKGSLGQLVPVKDYRAMASAIIKSLDEPIDPQRLIKRANEFSEEIAAVKYVELFLRIGR